MYSTIAKHLELSFRPALRINLSLLFISLNISLIAQNWNQILKATASDRVKDELFGYALAVSGNYAIVGTPYANKDSNGMNEIKGAGAAYIFKRVDSTWIQEAKIVAIDRAANDMFGYSVDIDGDYAIVGAWQKDKFAGAAYIFKRTGTKWTQQTKIIATDRTEDDQFGVSVAIHGKYAIVGAYKEDEKGVKPVYDAGAAYIFKQNDTTWIQEAKIVANNRSAIDLFGYSVAIYDDYAYVGAVLEDEDAMESNTLKDAGAVYVFKRTGTNWIQESKIVAVDRFTSSNFGNALSSIGDYLIVGAYFDDRDMTGANTQKGAGSAYIFKRTGTNWTQEAKLSANDRASYDQFGISVDMNTDYAIIGAYFNATDAKGENYLERTGAAYVFKRSGTTWVQSAKLTANDRVNSSGFGRSVAIEKKYAFAGSCFADKGTGINGMGAVYIFTPSVELIPNIVPPKFNIYPVPTVDLLTIIREPPFKENEYFTIVNVAGQIVMSVKAQQEINVSNLPAGMYFLKVGDVKAKFIKQ